MAPFQTVLSSIRDLSLFRRRDRYPRGPNIPRRRFSLSLRGQNQAPYVIFPSRLPSQILSLCQTYFSLFCHPNSNLNHAKKLVNNCRSNVANPAQAANNMTSQSVLHPDSQEDQGKWYTVSRGEDLRAKPLKSSAK